MKTNTISSKIKIIGILYITLITIIVFATIYLNHKNKKDALLINIAGKERMLTQKISKSIFYLHHHNKSTNFGELDKATNEFIYNLDSLEKGNTFLGIHKPPTDEIKNQLSKVRILWNTFFDNIKLFKKDLINMNKKEMEYIVNAIYETNNELLKEVDTMVYMYTIYTENKTIRLRYIQYFFTILIILLSTYSFYELSIMEKNAKKFFELSKQLTIKKDEPLKPIEIKAEKEIVEASDTINCFINKINSAVEYSTNASTQLDEITEELDDFLLTLNNSSDISKKLDRSEDIVIQSQENIINSTKKLKELKEQLDKVAKII